MSVRQKINPESPTGISEPMASRKTSAFKLIQLAEKLCSKNNNSCLWLPSMAPKHLCLSSLMSRGGGQEGGGGGGIIEWYWISANVSLEMYTAISIYVVGTKLQAYATRPNGSLGIHWNLHISEDENFKFLFLWVDLNECEVNVFALRSHFSIAFLSPFIVIVHRFNCFNSS